MKRFILAIFCVIAAVAPALAQRSLAGLIQAGNRDAALSRIRSGADVNEPQPDGTRPIHWAVYRIDYELLEALIARKAQVNVRNEFGMTPIAEAAKAADARMVKMMLDAGADPEGANADGQTALMLAIEAGGLPVVKMLIDAGANVNTIEKFHNQTPLMWAAAASRNAADMVKLLLSKGADFKPRALYSDWPSQITAEPRVQYRPVGGLTALLYAARDGCYDCVIALIDAGADPNVPTPEGVTALMLAIDNEHNEVARLLLERGANPHVWDWWGRTALYFAVDRRAASLGPGARAGRAVSRSGGDGASSMDLIRALVAANVDLNPELNMYRPSRGGTAGRFADPLLNTGNTPVFRATMAHDREVMEVLLAKGASPDVNAMGMTAFLVAAGVGPGHIGGTGQAAEESAGGKPDLELMELLLQHGANINAQITGSLTYSMRIGRAPSANEGFTALHAAVQAGRADLVQYLLQKGANPEIADHNGHKAIDLLAGAPEGGAAPPTGVANASPAGDSGRTAAGDSAAKAAEIRALLQSAGASTR